MDIPDDLVPHLGISLEIFNTLPEIAQNAILDGARAKAESIDAKIAEQNERLRRVYNEVCISDNYDFSEELMNDVKQVIIEYKESHHDNHMYRAINNVYAKSTLLSDIPYKTSVNVVQEGFNSKFNNKHLSIENTILNIDFENDIIVNDTSVHAINKIVQEESINFSCKGYIPYQVTAYFGGDDDCEPLFFNKNMQTFIEEIEKVVDNYDGAFMISSITVRFIEDKNLSDINDLDISAASGEGLPRRVEGTPLWLVDLHMTDSNCMLYSYHVWKAYSTDPAKLLEHMSFATGDKNQTVSRMLAEYRREMSDKGYDPIDGMYTVNQIRKACKANILVTNNIQKFTEAWRYKLREITQEKCCYYYECGHVFVIMHDDILKQYKDVYSSLKRLENKTVLMIAPRKVHRGLEQGYILTLDIECYRHYTGKNFDHIPLLLGIYIGGRVYHSFKGTTCIEQFFNFLKTYEWLDKKIVIWVHNGGNYDFHLMLDQILCNAVDNKRESVKITDVNGTIISMEFEVKTMNDKLLTVYLRDSYRLMPSSLEQLAMDYNMKGKYKTSTHIKNVSYESLLNNDEYEEYLKQDCKLLHDILKEYQTDAIENGYSDPLAFVSQSSYIKHMYYSKYYNKEKYPICTIPRHLHEWVCKAYNGGRTEVFKRGMIKDALFVYDFTSLYPYVGTFDLPYGIPTVNYGFINKILKEDAGTKFIRNWFGFVEGIVISTPNDKLPYLGIHKNHSYVFDHIKNKKVVITTVELKRIIELGYVFKVKKLLQYAKAPILEKMFNDLFNMKREAAKNNNKAKTSTAKLACVSGYGFFGFNKYNRNVLRIYGRDSEEELFHRKYLGECVYTVHRSGMCIVNEKINVLSNDTNVAIAAFISAYARDILYSLMTDIKNAGYKVYYCDTDSVITNMNIEADQDMKAKWMREGNGTNLGELKNEHIGDPIVEAVLATCKAYALKQKKAKTTSYTIKIKGLNMKNASNTKENLTEKQIETDVGENYFNDLANLVGKNIDCKLTDYEISLNKAMMIKYTTMISKTRQAKIKKSTNLIEKVQKKVLLLKYNKGIADENGDMYSLSGYKL